MPQNVWVIFARFASFDVSVAAGIVRGCAESMRPGSISFAEVPHVQTDSHSDSIKAGTLPDYSQVLAGQ